MPFYKKIFLVFSISLSLFGANRDFLYDSMEPLSATYGAFYKVATPSAKNLEDVPEVSFTLFNQGLKMSEGWRVSGSLGVLGLGLYQLPSSNGTWIDGSLYSLSIPLSRGLSLGYSFSLEGSSGEHNLFFQTRPIYWFSGAVSLSHLSLSQIGGSLALSFRPLGEWWTLSYGLDYRSTNPSTNQWRNNFYTSFRFFNALSVLAKYDFTELNVGLSVDIGFLTFSSRTPTLSSDRFTSYQSTVEVRFEGSPLIPGKLPTPPNPDGKNNDSKKKPLPTSKGIWAPIYLEGKIGDVQGYMSEHDYIPSLLELHDLTSRILTKPAIKGVIFEIKNLDIGYGSAEEIRNEILRLKKSGKKVYIFAQSYSQKEYYLASAADKIYIGKTGDVELAGFQSEQLYFKDLLNWVGVQVDVIQAGNYKSFGEPWARSNASSYSHEETEHLLQVLSGDIFPKIIASRGLKTKSEALYHAGPYTASEAISNALVDEVTYSDEVYDALQNDGVSFLNPAALYQNRARTWEGKWDPSLALLQVSGTISEGSSSGGSLFGEGLTGSDTFLASLDAAIANPATRGVLMRVNSGGGSVVASDLMWNGLRKKIYDDNRNLSYFTSFGDIAASGGYYISADADKIYTTPYTLTGSIGVIMTRPSAGELLKKLKVVPDGVTIGSNAGLSSLYHPLSPSQAQKVQNEILSSYREFLTIVKNGRGEDIFSNTDAVHQIAQGRVWTGLDALTNGLADEQGGIGEAFDAMVLEQNIPERYLNAVLYNPVSPGLFDPSSLLSGLIKMGMAEVSPFAELATALQGHSIRTQLRQQFRLYQVRQNPFWLFPKPTAFNLFNDLEKRLKAQSGLMYRSVSPVF